MINFQKYHGAGNDFIMINNLDKSVFLTPQDIQLYCNRNFGIGADGIILLEPSDKTDCFMNYYNSDGTIAQMCGNGARCTAKFYLEQTKNDKILPISIKLDTRAGVKTIQINQDDTYSVDMGAPIFESPDFPSTIYNTNEKMSILSIENYDFNCVSMGNPHAVTIVSNLNKIDLKNIGPIIENNKNFPNKINVEFVEKITNDYYRVKVWERGCGVTLACGTGACAVYSVLNKISPMQNFDEEITLEFPGGKLYLSQNHEGSVVLRGEASFVFKGEI